MDKPRSPFRPYFTHHPLPLREYGGIASLDVVQPFPLRRRNHLPGLTAAASRGMIFAFSVMPIC